MITVIDRDSETPIQTQLRQSIIEAIHGRAMRGGQKMTPSRLLARRLGIARNTVTAVYEDLVARGYLESVARRGYFVALRTPAPCGPPVAPGPRVDWDARFRQRPSRMRHIVKPSNWQDFPYPFVYGQVDPGLFPINTWRTCSRDALGRSAIDWWTADRAVEDDPLLVEQILSQILPQRGIYARPEEVLITLGTQEGLYLLSRLLVRADTRVGVETPGYPDARTIFAQDGARIVDLPVDAQGARLAQAGPLDVAVLTPTRQCPTMVAMSAPRRAEVLAAARLHDTILVEDDYEGETDFSAEATTLKSQDVDGRVAYLGTLSKVLAPGVRLGFMVADAALIEEARWLRRLIHRSAPLNNQRTAAIFLAEGHYQRLLRTLRAALERRFEAISAGCDAHLPGFRRSDSTGGSSLWLEAPPGLDTSRLFHAAAARGVLTESGDPFVPEADTGRYLRLGISYIHERRIEAGLRALGEAAQDCR
ncbi:PLP-dependent aminotransferase family protein (plasmid) [Paroceanicella profunda]|uniref:PLP-dependent aminotransferase family protein n=1 Tax=Paroceanicella profunda TaxID=2579971 RepID=A0A5B8G1A0_9RHOB|nr:PLP-dependent aminotransferase family protein [Paroceanicella profunda]QDL94495.1 PLP-dependent aminotransferase family protein [Paroceanicella profunda]